MQNMPFDMILAQPLAETFQCGGMAENVMAANVLAWNAMRSVLGGDIIEAWSLKTMQHIHVPGGDSPGVQFVAEFVRTPEPDEA